MKNKLIFLCLMAITWVSLLSQNDKLRIAIFDPTSSGAGIDEGIAVAVREIISSTFVNTGKYMIVERSLLEKVMNEQMFSNSGAVDDSQASEIGRLAGASKIVLSVITMAGQRYMLSIKMVDVNTASVERQKTQIVAPNQIFDIVEPLTYELLGETAAPPVDISQQVSQNMTAVQQQPVTRDPGNIGNQPVTSVVETTTQVTEGAKELTFIIKGIEQNSNAPVIARRRMLDVVGSIIEQNSNASVMLYLNNQLIGETNINENFQLKYADSRPGVHELRIVWTNIKWSGTINTSQQTVFIFEYKRKRTGFGYENSFELVK